MEVIVGLIQFICELTSNIAVAAWSYFQEKVERN
jgi:hypothetical protein